MKRRGQFFIGRGAGRFARIFQKTTGASLLGALLVLGAVACSSGGGGVPSLVGGGGSAGTDGIAPGNNPFSDDGPGAGTRSEAPQANPTPQGEFNWVVDGSVIVPPAFEASPGPKGTIAKNFVSRMQANSDISLSIFQRVGEGQSVSLIELAVFNDPLMCTKQQGGAGGPIPAQTIPKIEILMGSGRLYPLYPKLAAYKALVAGKHYRLDVSGDAAWSKFADGTGYVCPFLLAKGEDGPVPQFADLQPLFPANPGSIWKLPVKASYPGHAPSELAAIGAGTAPFSGTGNPWAMQGYDNGGPGDTGYWKDWHWNNIGAYHNSGDLNDLFYIGPTIYQQATRPGFYEGLNIDFNVSKFPTGKDQTVTILYGRPYHSGTEYLGRVPVPGGISVGFMTWDDGYKTLCNPNNKFFPDNEHMSMRRLSDYAFATGSPWAWKTAIYLGQVAKGMLHVMYYWNETPRAFLAVSELAYRAYLHNPADPSPVQAAIQTFEHYIDIGYAQPWSKGSSTTVQPLWAIQSDKWLGAGVWASASFEDLRAVPIMLRMGKEFNRPKLIERALGVCQYYCTFGYTNGAEGLGKGIKVISQPFDTTKFMAPGLGYWTSQAADLAGYNVVSALGLRLASDYLQLYPDPAYDGALFRSISNAILADDPYNVQFTWLFFDPG